MSKHPKPFLLLIALAAGTGCACAAPAPTVESGALWLPYFLGEDGVLPTYGASVAVDAQGGMHAAYCIYAGTDQGMRPGIYAYCPGDCAEQANWSHVQLGDSVQDLRLALDSQGRPRLILFGPVSDPETNSRMRYQYAECDAGWTNATNWKITTIATPIESVATREDDNNRYFAISPGGTAAFIYADTAENHHPGTFYMSCPGDCTDLKNWTETLITLSYIDQPSLTFSPDDHPRLVFGLFTEDSDLYLSYAQCDGAGTDPDQWTGIILSKIHGTATYSVQTDAAGRPRIAFASGSYAAAPFTDHQLYYLWCTEGSVTDIENWQFNNVGLSFTSGGVDLALDAQGRPRISCELPEGLGYAWCNNIAESDGAAWQHRTVESNDSLAANYEVLPINKCTLSRWSNGQRSSLALDAQGNPRIGYDAEHVWSGVYVDRPWEKCYFKDVTITRFAFFNVSPSLSVRRRIPGSVEIIFENGTLESAPAATGPWSSVPAASPLVLPLEGPQQFFRLRP